MRDKVADKTADGLRIASEHTYVVYDGRTGHVRHIHRSTFFEGAEATSHQDQEKRAMLLAERHGHSPEGLRVLSIEPHELQPDLHVDIETGGLTRAVRK